MTAQIQFGFQLECKSCNKIIDVGSTAKMRDRDDDAKEITVYFSPGTEAPDWQHVVGFSNGTGDSFECIFCGQKGH